MIEFAINEAGDRFVDHEKIVEGLISFDDELGLDERDLFPILNPLTSLAVVTALDDVGAQNGYQAYHLASSLIHEGTHMNLEEEALGPLFSLAFGILGKEYPDSMKSYIQKEKFGLLSDSFYAGSDRAAALEAEFDLAKEIKNDLLDVDFDVDWTDVLEKEMRGYTAGASRIVKNTIYAADLASKISALKMISDNRRGNHSDDDITAACLAHDLFVMKLARKEKTHGSFEHQPLSIIGVMAINKFHDEFIVELSRASTDWKDTFDILDIEPKTKEGKVLVGSEHDVQIIKQAEAHFGWDDKYVAFNITPKTEAGEKLILLKAAEYEKLKNEYPLGYDENLFEQLFSHNEIVHQCLSDDQEIVLGAKQRIQGLVIDGREGEAISILGKAASANPGRAIDIINMASKYIDKDGPVHAKMRSLLKFGLQIIESGVENGESRSINEEAMIELEVMMLEYDLANIVADDSAVRPSARPVKPELDVRNDSRKPRGELPAFIEIDLEVDWIGKLVSEISKLSMRSEAVEKAVLSDIREERYAFLKAKVSDEREQKLMSLIHDKEIYREAEAGEDLGSGFAVIDSRQPLTKEGYNALAQLHDEMITRQADRATTLIEITDALKRRAKTVEGSQKFSEMHDKLLEEGLHGAATDRQLEIVDIKAMTSYVQDILDLTHDLLRLGQIDQQRSPAFVLAQLGSLSMRARSKGGEDAINALQVSCMIRHKKDLE